MAEEIVKSDNTKGNPYHSKEDGKFVKKDQEGTANTEPKSSKLAKILKVDSTEANSKRSKLAALFSGMQSSDDNLEADLEDILRENGFNKNIEEMSEEELGNEISKHLDFFAKNNIKIGESFKGMSDKKLCCSNLRQLEMLCSKYPAEILQETEIQYKRLGQYTLGETRLGISVSTSIFSDTVSVQSIHAIILNSARFTDYKETKNIKQQCSARGESPLCDDDKYTCMTLTHEFGHAIHDYLFREFLKNQNTLGMPVFNGNQKEFKKAFADYLEDSIIKEAYKTYMQDNGAIGYGEFKRSTSEYGRTSNAEWIAENFASLHCGKPTKVAEALGKVLDKKFKKGE